MGDKKGDENEGVVEAEVQKSLNLMEAVEDCMQGVRNYRTHCSIISSSLRPLHDPLLHLARQPAQPSLHRLLQQDDTRELFRKFNAIVEEAVAVIRFSSNLTTLDKMLSQGEAKKRLQSVLARVQMISREMKCFLDFESKRNSIEWQPFLEESSSYPSSSSKKDAKCQQQSSLLPDLITFDD